MDDFNLGGWLGAIVIGGLAGWAASIVMKTDASMGLLANFLVGVVGAMLGNLLMPMIGFEGVNGFTMWSFVVALIGASVLLLGVRLLKKLWSS